jgi:methylthioribose-1-phosphate isomerase
VRDSDVLSPIWWEDDSLKLLDQTLLPNEERVLSLTRVEDVADAIKRLAVRGAPAIGVTVAYGLVLGVRGSHSLDDLKRRFEEACTLLGATRPTAVNLIWALKRQRRVFESALAQGQSADEIVQALLEEAHRIRDEDIEANRRLGTHGAALLKDGDRVLTHCNAGALATAGYGTALGVIRAAWEQGKRLTVWVDETRPLLQGARLTAWELQKEGIPYEIIVDGAAGALMAQGLVDAVITGADRVAANGDMANKIGTYALAVLAHHHGIPFYVALPTSTIDPGIPGGSAIPIEERDPSEVTSCYSVSIAPEGAQAKNMAFDVTPHELAMALITEAGVLRAPYEPAIREALASPESVYRHVHSE